MRPAETITVIVLAGNALAAPIVHEHDARQLKSSLATSLWDDFATAARIGWQRINPTKAVSELAKKAAEVSDETLQAVLNQARSTNPAEARAAQTALKAWVSKIDKAAATAKTSVDDLIGEGRKALYTQIKNGEGFAVAQNRIIDGITDGTAAIMKKWQALPLAARVGIVASGAIGTGLVLQKAIKAAMDNDEEVDAADGGVDNGGAFSSAEEEAIIKWIEDPENEASLSELFVDIKETEGVTEDELSLFLNAVPEQYLAKLNIPGLTDQAAKRSLADLD